VMDTSGRGLFFTDSGEPTPLWGVTWEKVETFLPGLREELFPDWQKRSNPKSNGDDAAKVSDTQDQNLSETNPVEVKPDINSEADQGCASERNVEASVTEKSPQELGETASNTANEGVETVDDVVDTEADKIAKQVDVDNGEASRDKPLDICVIPVVGKDSEEAVGSMEEAVGSMEEAGDANKQVGADAKESSQPQLASLSTTLETSILTSSIVSTQLSRDISIVPTQQPRERRESQPSLLPPASPSSPMEPPILPFTAFSLPTSPSHTASTLTFSPITPAPSILHPPAPPLATPRPQMAPPAPAPLPSLLPSSSSLQHAPSTAFSLPTLPPAPSNILPPSSPSKDEGGVETV